MDIIRRLESIRSRVARAQTAGLPDDVLRRFTHDRALATAVEEAETEYERLTAEFPGEMALDETAQVEAIQRHMVNFYPEDGVSPYVPLAACGPWIVTTFGAVLHDSGGYGMLGLGQSPERVLDAMSHRQVMANVMTPNYSQLRLTRALDREIGRVRGASPYSHYVFMNSGSESVTVATRICDVNTRLMTDAGGRHAGKPVRLLSLESGFHGRTERPSRYSDSTRRLYRRHLASYRDFDPLWTVAPNDIDGLRETYARADREGVFIEALFMEPVMGEGNPGMAVTPAFYDAARESTRAHGSLLLIDSIQAGLRATGDLSIVDYPGFGDCRAPDMETFSKAMNAGQYPLSVLALTESAAGLYRKGIYGNTMAANPRAMDVGFAVLGSLTPALRENIRARGAEFVERLEQLARDMDGAITGVQGTGLLLSCELSDAYKCFGADSTEDYLRRHGIGVIHGGRNSLRFTPHFAVTSEEIGLIVDAVQDALVNGPRLEVPVHAEAAESGL